MAEEKKDEQGGLDFQGYAMLFLGGLGGLILLIFVLGVVLALIADPGPTAARIRLLRDIFIIVMALEAIVIIVALATLIVQIARLVNLLQNEVQPIIDNTREATDTARGTAQFVGSNLTEPFIKTSAFLAGARAFTRELGGIRRAVKPTRNGTNQESVTDGE